MARNVATLVDPPRYIREPVRPLSPEEARRFMEAARGDLYGAVYALVLAQGLQPRTIMELLGHSQISLTMNTYAHVIPSLMQDAAQRMDALFEYEAVSAG